jgi:hypothetical protein
MADLLRRDRRFEQDPRIPRLKKQWDHVERGNEDRERRLMELYENRDGLRGLRSTVLAASQPVPAVSTSALTARISCGPDAVGR